MAKAIHVPITPGVARWARTTSGLSLEEAADLVHEPVAALASWERGERMPSLTQAKTLAHAYRRPLAALLLADVPVERRAPVDFRPGVSGKGRRITRPILLAIRRARRMQQAASELFEALELKSPSFDPSMAEHDPADLAETYRSLLRISVSDQLSWSSEYQALNAWRAAVENLNVLVLQSSMPVDEVRAFSLAPSSPAVIVLNSADAPTARVFSLFHELGHLVRGQEGICDPLAELLHLSQQFEEERFCNRFSGALLVPGQMLVHDDLARRVSANQSPEAPLGSLASRYRVSRQVMWYRLRDVGLISAGAFSAGWPVLGSEGPPKRVRETGTTFTTPPAWRRVLSEEGRGFVSRMLEGLDRGFLSPADMIDWLDIKTSDIGKLEHQLSASPK
jgi:Zn-dependent peptidase ImmA (M78 family)